jgi:7-cyano-7-deazaguanine synthase
VKGVVVFSGGLDSTVLLYRQISHGDDVLTVTFDYRQRHYVEVEAAGRILQGLEQQTARKIKHVVVDLHVLAPLIGKHSALLNRDVPLPDEDVPSRLTIVPNRNMIFLAIAGGIAIDNGCEYVAFGWEGHGIHPDCQRPFVEAMTDALTACHHPGVQLLAPFFGIIKATVIKTGNRLGVPFAETWSCFRSGAAHCGVCGACGLRKAAFDEAQIADPTAYEQLVLL